MMDGVRLVARLFGVIGWITVAIGVVGVLVVASQFGKFFGPGADVLTGIGLLAILVGSSLGPFSVWAGLTALCEIHERQKELLALHSTADRISSKRAQAGGTRPSASPAGQGKQGPAHDPPPWMVESLVEAGVRASTSSEGPPEPFEYVRGDRVLIIKESTLLGGKNRPGHPLGSVPAKTAGEVLSVYEYWVRVKTAHGDVGFVEAEALAPGEA